MFNDSCELDLEAHSLETRNNKSAKQICIIGAGAAGLAALKSVTEISRQYKQEPWQVVAFEARDGLGGVWYEAISILSTRILM